MKQVIKFLILLFGISVFTATYAQERVIVKTIPVEPKSARVARPNKYEVWVPSDWVPVNGKYFFMAGRWAFPPTAKSYYQPGSWKKAANGYYRIAGYWITPR